VSSQYFGALGFEIPFEIRKDGDGANCRRPPSEGHQELWYKLEG
jgi:hypothetical protein